MPTVISENSVTKIGVHGAIGAGDTYELRHGHNKAFQVSGTFVGTIKIQVSLDASNWIDLVTTSSTGGFENTAPWKYVRSNCSAYTSGTATVELGV